ncbi:hypothetical protein K492DRAFT_223497 [Lichtheimia hyalospora FSU 10163]|nr:hypothetical protein K492DRAFT_223497 [Lichtheimia hyalospora FSU 10163]
MISLVILTLACYVIYRYWKQFRTQFAFLQRIKAYQALTPFTNTPQVLDPVWTPLQQGSIPKWLNGVMYRIGPGRYNLGKDDNSYMIKHAFDGMPFMHRFELSAKRQSVRYNSRHLAESVERDLVQGRGKQMAFFGHVQELSLWDMFAAMVDRSKMVVNGLKVSDNDASAAMVGVTATPNYPVPLEWMTKDPFLVAKTDLNLLQQVHPESLEPQKLYKYGGYDSRIQGDLSAAHHQYDPITEEIFNFSLKLGPVPKITVFSISSTGQVSILAEITHRKLPGNSSSNNRIRPSYIHSFFLTRNYIVIPEYPLYYEGLDFLVTGNAMASMRWDNNAPTTYFHVIGRRPDIGHVVSIPTSGFYSFHGANAWDYVDMHGNPVIELDVCAFPDGDILYQLHTFGTFWRTMDATSSTNISKDTPKGMTLPPKRQDTFGDLRRYRLTWSGASYSTLAPNIEFARFSQHYALKPYRYVWACQFKKPLNDEYERYAVVKVDLDTGAIMQHDSTHMTFSEPIFIPKPGSDQEDDGVVVCLGTTDDGSYLVILDAKTMEKIAQCHLGSFSISTFHGSFVDEQFQNVSIN